MFAFWYALRFASGELTLVVLNDVSERQRKGERDIPICKVVCEYWITTVPYIDICYCFGFMSESMDTYALFVLIWIFFFSLYTLTVGWAYIFNIDDRRIFFLIRFALRPTRTVYFIYPTPCYLFILCVYKLKIITVSCNTKYCATQHSSFGLILCTSFFLSFFCRFTFFSFSSLLLSCASSTWALLINKKRYPTHSLRLAKCFDINFNYYLCIIISDSFWELCRTFVQHLSFYCW